jgi:hypothetical protein
MKKMILTLTVATGFLFGGNYSTAQASNHIGEKGTVCGVVTGGYYAKSTRGKPTFINLDGRYPNHKFTILIWGENRHNFHAPERSYDGQRVCVTGYIELHKGLPEIEVEDSGQLR